MSRSQQALLREYGIRPVKRRGQNFLVDGNLARAIAAEVLAIGDAVLELGAGGGALTGPLLEQGGKVVAVEVDHRLCRLLADVLGGRSRFSLVEADLARCDLGELLERAGTRPVVAGNLPYMLTSQVLFGLADRRDFLAGAVLMVQREVAARLTAGAGCREYGILAAVLGSIFEITVVRQVPAAVFWPRPDVASAVIKLLPGAVWPESEFQQYRETVRTLFGQRRKQVGTLLRTLFDVPPSDISEVTQAAGIEPAQRPEQLPPESLRRLARVLGRRGAS